MAFVKRTWLARLGTGLNKFIIGEKDAQDKQTLTNSPDSITQDGDTISAQNLNDLEDRIEAGFNEKQDNLTFDNVPTEGSNNPVKSGGIYTALAGKQDTLTFDTVPTSGSTNPVTSGGIYDAIKDPQFKIQSKTWSSSGSSTGAHNTSATPTAITGYTPVGIVGFNLSRYSGTATFGVTGVYLASGSVRIDFNVDTLSSSSYYVSCTVYVLYEKN